jgi:hypothetical protein
VLWPEWLEPELIRRESERDYESGRDERSLRHTPTVVDPAGTSQRNENWDRCSLHPRLREGPLPRSRQSGITANP